MENLAGKEFLCIEQNVEWGQVLTGLDTKNRYVVKESSDSKGNLYYASETGGNILARNLLLCWRPFTIDITSSSGRRILRLDRPFKFPYSEMTVFGADGAKLGSIEEQGRFFSAKCSIFGNDRSLLFKINGLGIVSFWPFRIFSIFDGKEKIGEIKRYFKSGLIGYEKEAFGANNIGVTFPKDLDANKKALLLAAAFLIDFTHFEFSSILERLKRLSSFRRI